MIDSHEQKNQAKVQKKRINHLERELHKEFIIVHGIKEKIDETQASVNNKIAYILNQIGIQPDV